VSRVLVILIVYNQTKFNFLVVFKKEKKKTPCQIDFIISW